MIPASDAEPIIVPPTANSSGTKSKEETQASAIAQAGGDRADVKVTDCWSPILVLPALLVKLLLRVVADCRDLASCS